MNAHAQAVGRGAVSITSHDDVPVEDAARVDSGLDAANRDAAPLHDVRPLAAFARDASGDIVGGVVGRTWGRCCEIQQLWVEPAQRRAGIGARLVREAERVARARGCRTFYLETFSFQAPRLYRALGYAVAHSIDGFAPGIVKYSMVRRDAHGERDDGLAVDPFPHAAQGIVLRRLGPGDLAAFQAYRHDPEVGRYQGWQPTPDPEAAAFLDEMQRARCFVPGAWFQVGIADIETSTLVGDVGLWVSGAGDTAEIGISLARRAQRAGIATRAMREAIALLFAHTSVERVRAVTDARNAASVRLLGRVGMQHVATRDAEFRGERCREHVYVVARAEPVA